MEFHLVKYYHSYHHNHLLEEGEVQEQLHVPNSLCAIPAATAEMNEDLSGLMVGSRFVGLNPERFISVQRATHNNFGNH